MGKSDQDPVIAGVPLAQFAAVTAALGAAFPLKAVLAVEGLDAARWAQADRGWTERLDVDPGLLGRYQSELAAAEDRLARSVEPIDTDLGAWLSFLAAVARSPEMLKPLGIGPDDVARLQRRWDARMREEPDLERRAADLRREGPAKLPPLRVVKGKLTRSGTGLAAAPPAPGPASFSAPVAAPYQPAPVAASYQPAPPPPAPPPAYAPAAVPAAHAPPRSSYPPAPAFAEGYAPEPRPPGADEDGTLVAFAIPVAPLPFRPAADGEFLEMQANQGAVEGEGSDGRTVALEGLASLRNLEVLDEQTFVPPEPLPIPLSLEQHASLCVEIAIDPARTAEALARYQVSATDKDRTDAHYRERLRVDPEVRAQWHRAFEIYRTWYLANRPRF